MTVNDCKATLIAHNGSDILFGIVLCRLYTEATLKFLKLNARAQQREAVVQGRSLSPYRLRYTDFDMTSFGVPVEKLVCFLPDCFSS
ncbi:MAG: hypothetical protein LBJ00_13185 [Planctomycetaceae bacterium]|nr:hypothetical protein [Planctomycetaceae bacterium]